VIDIKMYIVFEEVAYEGKKSILAAAVLSYFILAEYSQECVQDLVYKFYT